MTTIIRAVVVLIVAAVTGIVALAVFVPGDNTAIALHIVGLVTPTVAALLALAKSTQNGGRIADTHEQITALSDVVNGRKSDEHDHPEHK